MTVPAITTPDPTTDQPPRPRRWIPLSLRMFVAVLALLACGALWIGVRAYRQYVALTEIERNGGSVEIRPRGPEWLRARWGTDLAKSFDDVFQVGLVGTKATDAVLRHVNRLEGLEHLDAQGTQITDAGMVNLKALRDLNTLWLSNTNLTDAGLANLKTLPRLKQLLVDGTQVTNAGLVHLHSMTSLTSLALGRTRVTDTGLAGLRTLTALEVLYLDSSQATDMGLRYVGALTNLRVLWIDNNKVDVVAKANDEELESNPSVVDLVKRLDVDVKRRHFWNHEDTNDFEAVLRKIIRRGGTQVEQLLSVKLQGEASELAAAQKRVEGLGYADDARREDEPEIDRLSNNLELLTALRRVQLQPDPLSIAVALPRDLKADTRKLPSFSVSLKSVDVERLAVWVQLVPHFHGTRREAQWRFEVRDRQGALLPIRPNTDMFRSGGGFKSDGWLHFGEILTTTLPMGNFIDIPKAGEYTVTIVYHAKLPIADFTSSRELDDLITFRSEPFTLIVEQGPRHVIRSSKADRDKASLLIRDLPGQGVVKSVIGKYDANDYEFVDPVTPAGQLLTMDWRAVPTLLESLTDETLSRHRKAWALTLLHTITAERDFDPCDFRSSALPSFERRSGKYFGSSRGGGAISPRDQDQFIRRWRNFANEYFEIRDDG
jgi:Leucine-rich repeat (LRR) protein